jgi:imidazoleglycerol phosphate synthase cyclase subunit
MLSHRVIPCLDCRDGRVVKGVNFSNLRDMGSPAEHAANYEQQGADELVLLDVAATVEARENQTAVVASVREQLSIPLTVGGGVRDAESARRLLQSGADKVGINSAAVARPELIRELADEFGSQCVVLAVDAIQIENGNWRVVVQSGRTQTPLDVVEWCQQGCELGAGEILLTSWNRDGTGSGYDLALLEAVSKTTSVPLIASGGANEPEDLVLAIESGADAVLAATIFHSGRWSVRDVKRHLAARGLPVREA